MGNKIESLNEWEREWEEFFKKWEKKIERMFNENMIEEVKGIKKKKKNKRKKEKEEKTREPLALFLLWKTSFDKK